VRGGEGAAPAGRGGAVVQDDVLPGPVGLGRREQAVGVVDERPDAVAERGLADPPRGGGGASATDPGGGAHTLGVVPRGARVRDGLARTGPRTRPARAPPRPAGPA